MTRWAVKPRISVTGSATVTFTSFQNLIGGTAKNTFIFSDGAGISGNLDGGSGRTKLDYSAYSSSIIGLQSWDSSEDIAIFQVPEGRLSWSVSGARGV